MCKVLFVHILCICIYTYIYIYTHTHILAYANLYTNQHPYIALHVCMGICVYMCMCIGVYIYIYIYKVACSLCASDALLEEQKGREGEWRRSGDHETRQSALMCCLSPQPFAPGATYMF